MLKERKGKWTDKKKEIGKREHNLREDKNRKKDRRDR